MDLRFSLFHSDKGLNNITPLKEISLRTLTEVLDSDKLKRLSIALNKLELPYITAYGSFNPRRDKSMIHYNRDLIALDFDNLTTGKAKEVYNTLKLNKSVVLCFISPSKKGVKALVYNRFFVSSNLLYKTLKHNKNRIVKSLGLDVEPDLAQFKLSQPLFLFNDGENMYHNLKPTCLGLEIIKPKEFIPKPIKPLTIELKEKQKTRIEKYLVNALEYVVKDLNNQSKGNRHNSIVKVKGIKSLLHYAPHLENEFKSVLLSAVVGMYEGQQDAQRNNVYNSFNDAWNSAEMKGNTSIELIISEVK